MYTSARTLKGPWSILFSAPRSFLLDRDCHPVAILIKPTYPLPKTPSRPARAYHQSNSKNNAPLLNHPPLTPSPHAPLPPPHRRPPLRHRPQNPSPTSNRHPPRWQPRRIGNMHRLLHHNHHHLPRNLGHPQMPNPPSLHPPAHANPNLNLHPRFHNVHRLRR